MPNVFPDYSLKSDQTCEAYNASKLKLVHIRDKLFPILTSQVKLFWPRPIINSSILGLIKQRKRYFVENSTTIFLPDNNWRESCRTTVLGAEFNPLRSDGRVPFEVPTIFEGLQLKIN